MLIKIAEEIGFESFGLIRTSDIPLSPEFRKYCEENVCGLYGTNYSCPPECGTTDEMRDHLRSRQHALVLKTLWEMDYSDVESIMNNKKTHNSMVRELIKKLPEDLQNGFMVSASGCSICETCTSVEHKPCRFPELKASCVSAYCINVAELCKKLDWTYFEDGKVGFFGMYVFDMAPEEAEKYGF